MLPTLLKIVFFLCLTGLPLLSLRWSTGQLPVSEGNHLQPGRDGVRLVVQLRLRELQGGAHPAAGAGATRRQDRPG